MIESISVSDLIACVWAGGLNDAPRKEEFTVRGTLSIAPRGSILIDPDKPENKVFIVNEWLFNSIDEKTETVGGSVKSGQVTIECIAEKSGFLSELPELPVMIFDVFGYEFEFCGAKISDSRACFETRQFEVLARERDRIVFRGDHKPDQILVGCEISELVHELDTLEGLVIEQQASGDRQVTRLASHIAWLTRKLAGLVEQAKRFVPSI